MKRAAVITMGVSLAGEKGYSRFRTIGEMFCRAGYDTTLLTTRFQHWEKRHRDLNAVDSSAYPYRIRFFDEPGYRRNIDIRRIRSHAKAAENLAALLREDGPYDLVYCEIPPNDVARAAGTYALERQIPFVIDINDLWPEAMKMVLDVPGINKILYRKFEEDRDWVYRNCSGIVGTSDEYRDKPFAFRRDIVPAETVYVGNEIQVFDEAVSDYQDIITKSPDEFRLTYAGTIGKSYDLLTLVRAGEILCRRHYDRIRIHILGDGPERRKLERYVKRKAITNVQFAGYLPYEKMAAYLAGSDLLINSFKKKAPQSIVTKIGDYLAAGKPMINTSLNPEFCDMVRAEGFGKNIQPENPAVLARTIIWFSEHPEEAEKMGMRARETAVRKFDRKNSYTRITDLADRLTGRSHQNG